MRLISPEQYREAFFAPGSAPTARTVRSQIKSGKLPGKFLGGRYYVDLDELDRRLNLRATLAAREAELLKDPALAELM